MRAPQNCAGAWIAALLLGCSDMPAMQARAAPARVADAGRAVRPTATAPRIPVGLDAYRDWERLPVLRIGARSYMRSTYDRAGGNEGADASHFLRSEAGDFNVVLDVAGPGVLYFARANHWHGSPWRYVVDGREQVLSESSTADPTQPVADAMFMPASPFAAPLALTWPATRGSDLSWVPIEFTRSLTLGYGRTHYGTGYFIYQLYPEGAGELSHSLASFDASSFDAAAGELLARAGEDLAPDADGVDSATGVLDIGVGQSVELARLEGARALRAIKLRVSRDQALAAGRARLRITWDDRSQPSVDAPLALFFGAGTLYNRDAREWLVRALFVNVHFTADQVELASYFPMPFFERARIELVGGDAPLAGVAFELRSTALAAEHEATGYFHATYRDHGVPTPGQDLVVLDTQVDEGGGQHCGSFNGMSWIFSHDGDLTTLEGDPRFFFDDSRSPQVQGTGTEEWGGGGDYWGGENTSLPLLGHPSGAASPILARDSEDLIESAYRLLLADAMPFGRNARIQLEHGGNDDSTEHYESVAYWYGSDRACLEPTDALDVGDLADERRHDYRSPAASAVEKVSSRYELGPDHLNGGELFAELEEDGRHMTGTSEFKLRIRPDNLGVLLRRRLDYGFPDQRAEVWVADDRDGATYERAGTWYLAGSNRCVYSNPGGELDPPAIAIESSNRRLREDEFSIAGALTQGRSSLRIRLVWSKLEQPLAPGQPLPALAWSELAYAAYAWVLPE